MSAFARGRHGWLGIVLPMLALAAAGAVMQLALGATRAGLVDREADRLRAIADIQAGITDSHLWMEEFVTGDAVTHARIWTGLDRARELATALAADARAPAGMFAMPAGDDLAGRLEALASDVVSFAGIAARREADYRAGLPVGVGSGTDERYDQAFDALVTRARGIRAEIEGRMHSGMERAALLGRGLLAAWFALVAVALLGSWLLERRRRAAERSLREIEAQVVQVEKLEAVAVLAGGIAHDINNYLGAISAQAELGLRKLPAADHAPEQERLRQRLRDIVATAKRGAALIQRLLLFSRRARVSPETIDLDALLHELEPLLRQLLGDAARLELSPAAPWRVRADPAQLEQVVVNLAVNARDALREGVGNVAIETRNATLAGEAAARIGLGAGGDYVALAVRDDGAGIAPEHRLRIFEPFYTTKPRTSNSGLGLATAFGIVREHGGTIDVQSTPGHGATFTVYLPRVPDRA